MLARNRCFRIAALLTAASYLIYAAKELIEADHLFRAHVEGGYEVAIAIYIAGRFVGACGWVAVATAFGPETDWRRLRLGATIVVSAYITGFVGSMFNLLPTLANDPHSALRGVYVWIAVSALLISIAAVVAGSGFAESRRGAARASRLRLGLAIATASSVAGTVALIAQQTYFSEQGYVSELTIGTVIEAVGQAGFALATLALTVGARWALGRREARLAKAAAGAAVATLLVALGEAIVATGFTSHGAPTWQGFTVWLAVACSVLAIAIFAAISRGARAATQPP